MNWIRFDLHQHTKDEIPADWSTYSSTYTHRKFKDLLLQQKVQLKSVTNHNILNIVDHIKYALICNSLDIAYLPGVEIDYVFGDKRLHAISILNPHFDIILYSDKLKNIVKQKPKDDDLSLTKDDFSKLHQSMEYIFIPHYMKSQGIRSSKSSVNAVAEDWVIEMIKNGQSIPVIFENTKEHFKYTVHDILERKIRSSDVDYVPCISGSDSKFDNDISRKAVSLERIKYLMAAEPTYRGLEISVRNYQHRIIHENDKIDRNNYIKQIKFHENPKFENLGCIELSPALNVIIGPSGSGKTLLLNEIYYQSGGNSLNDVISKNNEKSKSRPYSNKIGDNKWIEILCKKNDDNLKVTEIPNVYNKILRYVDDSKHLGELFKISDIEKAKSALFSFISDGDNFQQILNSNAHKKKIIDENIIYVHNSINFINKNKSEEIDFKLSETVIEELPLKNIRLRLSKISKLISTKKEITSYFNDIHNILNTKNSDDSVTIILTEYNKLLVELEDKRKKIDIELIYQKIDNRLGEIINNSIGKSVKRLGQRAQAVNENKTIFENQKRKIIDNLKDYMMNEFKLNNIKLQFPVTEIQQILAKENSNKIARYQLSQSTYELENIEVFDSKLVNIMNKKTKLANMDSPINLMDSTEVEKVLEYLNKVDVSFSSFISNNLDVNLQLFVQDEWQNIHEINPGDVAKVSMRYYFDDIIKNEQPDVIFIDQPENDLDKNFITNVLSEFIKDSKLKQQIIITSHDPILTINSDVNTIIEANLSKNNKIKYLNYKLEETEKGEFVTDKVAKILDGSKKNVKNRYQLYGGILRDEN